MYTTPFHCTQRTIHMQLYGVDQSQEQQVAVRAPPDQLVFVVHKAQQLMRRRGSEISRVELLSQAAGTLAGLDNRPISIHQLLGGFRLKRT